MTTCPECGRPKALDDFAGEGGMGAGLMRAGFCVDAVDKVPNRKTEKGQQARLSNYPSDCPAARRICADAIEYIIEHGHEYAYGHGSPTCTGYSRGTAAIPNRVARYDRLIPATREAFLIAGIPYTIENVFDARHELVDPIMLCGRTFGLTATDTDGTPLTLDRHRMFESNVPLTAPVHVHHDWRTDRRDGIQVAGSYGGARRDKDEARYVRGGGYVPASLEVQQKLLGTPWMTEKGCQLSVPPIYGEYIGRQVLAHLQERAA